MEGGNKESDKVIDTKELVANEEVNGDTPATPSIHEEEGADAPIVIPEEINETEEPLLEKASNWFTKDNYYAAHPENILGEAYESTGRYGAVTKYRGNIDNISGIAAETNFLVPFNVGDNVLISTEKPTIVESLNNAGALANAEAAIEQSKKNLAKKVVNKTNSTGAAASYELQSINEIYDLYNKNISLDEFLAFMWYRDSIGERLSNHWYDLAFSKGATIDYMYSEDTLKKWVSEGILFYYSGSQVKKGSKNLIPSYLYLAENIWHKQAQIQLDKAAIIAEYGEATFTLQETELTRVFRVKYEKRLVIKGTGADDGLILLPISDFAKKFSIKTLIDEEPFKFKKISAQSNKLYGKPDFLSPDFGSTNSYGRNAASEFEELTLTDAFCAWLVKDKTIEFRKGSNYREIIEVYIFAKQKPRYESHESDPMGRKREDAQFERAKARAKEEGDRLFADFLNTQLTLNDRIRLETQWNGTYNSYVPIDFTKVPVVFECAKTYRNEFVDIRPEKREAAAYVFSEGSGCLAYDTGVGKTFSSIFTMAQFLYAGYCKRALVVVPNQVYKQFMNEVRGLLPQIHVHGLYNLSKPYMEEMHASGGIKENSITIMTYEGFRNIGFSDNTASGIISELYEILNQGGAAEYMSEKKKASFYEKLETLVGRGLRGTMVNIEDLGFDYFTFDEAHKMKKVFTTIKGNTKENETEGGKQNRERNRYDIQSGTPSTIALKGFMLSYYIQKQNKWRNVCLLTATPFTNSPLEIFSMLCFLAYKKLKDEGLNSLQNFFDTYIDVSYELVINSRLQPERKQVILGFNNLVPLQQLIRRFINYKGENDVKANKPNKIVLPLLYKSIDGKVIQLGPGERVETNLSMTNDQQNMMDQIKDYVAGNIELSELNSANYAEDYSSEDEDSGNEGNATKGNALDYTALDENDKLSVRILRGMSYARNLALSPYLYEHSRLTRPTYREYIESSPKLHYVVKCIKSVKDWHDASGTPVSGQIIYMDRGIQHFRLIKEYLVKECGYKEHEVETVYSGLPKEGPRSKSGIQNRFLGQRWDEQLLDFVEIPDADRVKIIIGSSTIREGMNLQKHTSTLYNCFIDWNPTDAKQLDGRAHRQGNLFNNVRIVIPLMIDSLDIFIFQKLEEKTSRINTIWATDGKENVLKLEDFNPKELKNSLIRDVNVLAELSIKEAVEKLTDEKGSIDSEKKRIENIKEYQTILERKMNSMEEFIADFRELKEFDKNTPIYERAKYLVGKIQDFVKKPTNKAGELLFSASDWKWSYETKIKPIIKAGKEKVDEHYKGAYGFDAPYSFKEFNTAQRQLAKEVSSFLIPKGIKLSKIDSYVDKLTSRFDSIDKEVEKMESEDNIKRLAEEIREERKKSGEVIGNIYERIAAFGRLNYLLGDKKVAQTPAPMTSSANDGRSKLRDSIRRLSALLKEKYAKGGSLGFEPGDLVCDGKRIGLIVSHRKEEDGQIGYDVLYRSLNSDAFFEPSDVLTDIIPDHLEKAISQTDIKKYTQIAQKHGIEINPKYAEAEAEVEIDEYAQGGEIKPKYSKAWYYQQAQWLTDIFDKVGIPYEIYDSYPRDSSSVNGIYIIVHMLPSATVDKQKVIEMAKVHDFKLRPQDIDKTEKFSFIPGIVDTLAYEVSVQNKTKN